MGCYTPRAGCSKKRKTTAEKFYKAPDSTAVKAFKVEEKIEKNREKRRKREKKDLLAS